MTEKFKNANSMTMPMRYNALRNPFLLFLMVCAANAIILVALLKPAAETTNAASASEEQWSLALKALQTSTDALRRDMEVLQAKQNAFLSYDSDPFLSSKVATKCKNQTRLSEYCNGKCINNMVCLDDFPYNNCTIYDFGVRAQPQFGYILSKPPFNCQVHAFDPSPITKEFYEKNPNAKLLKDSPNYHLHLYGGGGQDEKIQLREYNWNQVSIYAYPPSVVNPNNCSKRYCQVHNFGEHTKEISLPVRSVDSIMKELGHDHLTILKIDTEGSEFRMLESLITTGACRHLDQLSLEWHHYDFDIRYGSGASPHLNVFARLLQQECNLYQYWIATPGGSFSRDKLYVDMDIVLRYNLAAFRRVEG